MVPENQRHYTHNYEGPDDMPVHIKAVLIGSSITVPITAGRFNVEGSAAKFYVAITRARDCMAICYSGKCAMNAEPETKEVVRWLEH